MGIPMANLEEEFSVSVIMEPAYLAARPVVKTAESMNCLVKASAPPADDFDEKPLANSRSNLTKRLMHQVSVLSLIRPRCSRILHTEHVGDLLSLCHVRIQQDRRRLLSQDRSELPAEIVSVLKASVHALASFGRVGVASIASQEDAIVFGELISQSLTNGIS